MIETQDQNRKLHEKSLFMDALYYSLIHKGVKEERARLEVERIIRRKKTDELNN